MTIIRRSTNWLPGVFNDFFGNEWVENSNKSLPAINIKQLENSFVVEVAAPGMTKEDCNVSLDEENNLVIAFKKESHNEEQDKDGHYLRREFSYSEFKRRMILPDNVKREDISAKVENGVLSIEIPTLNEEEVKPKAKQIEIK